MRLGRLVIDVSNRLVWSRRDDWACCDRPMNPEGPNPPVPVGNSTVQACVQFVEGSFLPIIEEEDEDVDDDSPSANTPPSLRLMRFLSPNPRLMVHPLLMISLFPLLSTRVVTRYFPNLV